MKRATFHLHGLSIDYRLIYEPIIKLVWNLFCRHLNGKMGFVDKTVFVIKRNDMLAIFVLWGVSVASMLKGTKGMWGHRTPEIRYFGVPNTLTNSCFKLTISMKYSHFHTSQQPSKWSRNSKYFRKNSIYRDLHLVSSWATLILSVT
jgi:hypothetical protein